MSIFKKKVIRTDDELIAISKDITDLCIDEPLMNNGIIWTYDHHLPLKDETDIRVSKDNWNLPHKQKKEILHKLDILADYAADMINKYRDKGWEPYSFNNTVCFEDELLPRWIVFPHYPRKTLGWRMGLGEVYASLYHSYLHSLSDIEKKEHEKKYPMPEYFKLFECE